MMRHLLLIVLLALAAPTPATAQQRSAYIVLELPTYSAEDTVLHESLGELFQFWLQRERPTIPVQHFRSTGPTIELALKNRQDAARAIEVLSSNSHDEFEHPEYSFRLADDGVIVAETNPARVTEENGIRLAELVERTRRRFGEGAALQVQGNRLVARSTTLSPEEMRQRLDARALVTFHLVVETQEDPLPPELLLAMPHSNAPATREVVVDREPVMTGEMIERVSPAVDEVTGETVLHMQFDTDGGRAFCEITRAHAGRRFAILVDGLVITAPTIHEAICGGSAQISGNFDPQSASELTLQLQDGGLHRILRVVAEGYGEPPS